MKNRIFKKYGWIFILIGILILVIVLNLYKSNELIYGNWAIKDFYNPDIGQTLKEKRKLDYSYMLGLKLTLDQNHKKFIMYTMDSTVSSGNFEVIDEGKELFLKLSKSKGLKINGVYSMNLDLVNDYQKRKVYSLKLSNKNSYFYCDKSVVSMP